jgi:hypothetical protein
MEPLDSYTLHQMARRERAIAIGTALARLFVTTKDLLKSTCAAWSSRHSPHIVAPPGPTPAPCMTRDARDAADDPKRTLLRRPIE